MTSPHPGILELSILPTLSVHCFSRDGREAGPGPLFILREWDLKVIRTIGHKPKCKGPNQEQALRACVRQGLLSMQLKTENATKDEIQLLKQVGVLGKRAPSGSLIGAADLLRLLEYFSKRDVADAFRVCMKKQRDEGVVSEEVWKEIAAVREKDVLHKFKINTEEHRDDEQQRGTEKGGGKGGEKKRKKGSTRSSSGQSRKASSSSSKGKARKRKSDSDEGAGRKRRRGSVSSSSLRSSSSSSMSSLDSDNEAGKKRSREHRNGRKNRPTSPEQRRDRGEREGQPLRAEDYPHVLQLELLQQPPGAFGDVRMAYAGGQRRQTGGGHTVQLLQQGQLPTIKREMNGVQQHNAGLARGQFTYSTSSSPSYALPSTLPQSSSPTSTFNGLYNTGRLPSYNSLTSLSSYSAPSQTSSHLPLHMHSTIHQQSSPYSSSPSHGSPLLATVSISPVIAQTALPQGGAGQKPDGLEVLMQALHGKEGMHEGQTNGGQGVHPQRRSSSPRHVGHGQGQQHGGHEGYQQQQQQSQLELQRAQHLQSQHNQLYAQQQHIQAQQVQQQQQQHQQQQSQSALSYQQERSSQLPSLQGYLIAVKAKESPPYLANSSFTYAAQPPPLATFHIKKEGPYTANLGHATTVHSPVSVSLPSIVSSSTILSPLTMGSSTPTSSALLPHRPQARPSLSPASSFSNLAALTSHPSHSASSSSLLSSNLTRTISSSSLTLGLPNVSSVTSLSSLGGPSTSLSYTQLHTSMSMTSLDAADHSDADDTNDADADDDDLGGDAGIQNGIIGFDDDIEGADVIRPFVASTSFYTYDPSSSSPLPRIPSIASLTEVGGVGVGGGVGGVVVGLGGVVMPRVGSNLSTLTSQFLPSPPSSRPSSPRGGRAEAVERLGGGGRMSPQLGQAGVGGRGGQGGEGGVGMGQGGAGQPVTGTAVTAEG